MVSTFNSKVGHAKNIKHKYCHHEYVAFEK